MREEGGLLTVMNGRTARDGSWESPVFRLKAHGLLVVVASVN